MCRGPLAYGHATATRIRCGVRFGEMFLQVDRGLGHLTEGVFLQRTPRVDRCAAPPTHDSERAECEPDQREAEEPGPRTIVITRGVAFAGKAFARLRLRGRTCAHDGRSRGAPKGRLVHQQRARPLLTRSPRRREGPPWLRHRDICTLHRARRTRAPRGSRHDPLTSPRPLGSNSRWSNRRRTDRGSRRRDDPRRWRGLLQGAGTRFRRRGPGPGGRLGDTNRPRRQERQRVEIAVGLGGQSNSEVDRGHTPLAGTELGFRYGLSFRDRGADPHAEGAEMEKRDRVAVLGPEGDRPPAAGHGSGECDHAGDRSEHVLSGRGRDLDPAVLPGRVRVALDVEGAENSAGHRPAPGRRG